MNIKNKQDQNIKRNSFVALCDYASRNNWCWKLFCTTCGHGAFSISFSKIVNDKHPDDDSFWPYGMKNHAPLKEADEYRDFWRVDASIAMQIKLASIVAEAKVGDIQTVAKFPDWLGYIGLVINHCPRREARKIISESFLPQFIEMLKNNKEICEYLQEKQTKQELLSINDLSRIESKSVDLVTPLLPLITDIL